MSLEFRQVSHSYGRRPCLSGITLAANPGEILCLLGPSGSGKTTLLRLAAGLERLREGEIWLDGAPLAQPRREPPPEQRPVGLVFQDHVLFPHRTVAENVAFGLTGPAQADVSRHLAAVGLAGYEARYPHTLSGGQQQRVALARALAPQPRVLLMDEPFANVDVTLRRALREDARQAVRAQDAITVLVTHDPGEAMEMADRIAVLEDGRIVQSGRPIDLFDAPDTALVAAMFADAQQFEGVTENGRARTPYGDAPAPDLPDGLKVDVVTRPVGLMLRSARPDAPSPLRIADIRFLGADWLVLIAATQESGHTERLRVRLKNLDHFEIGSEVGVVFDKTSVFVFPQTN